MLRPTENERTTISVEVLQNLRLADSRPLEHAKTLKQVLTEVVRIRSFSVSIVSHPQFDAACSMVAPPSVCVVVGATKLRDQLLTETFRKCVLVPKCLRGVLDLATLASHFYPAQCTYFFLQHCYAPGVMLFQFLDYRKLISFLHVSLHPTSLQQFQIQ